MRCYFVVNPKAGGLDNEKIIREALSKSKYADDCEVYVTTGIKDATRYVKQICEERPKEEKRFIACGGDGTINEVFNGAVGAENTSVTCYPCGSGNDFVKTFGGAVRFTDVDKLIEAPTQKLDLMKIGDRYSDNVVNFGFDTFVAITVNEDRDRTGHGSKSSYTKGIIKSLISHMKNEFKVYCDGELFNPEGVDLFCTIANGQYVGGSFKCAPRAVPDDGLMEVCIIKPVSRLLAPKLIGVYTKGEHLDDPSLKDKVRYTRAKKVEVVAPEGFAYSLDGEIIYDNHFTVEIVEGALDLAVPQ